MSLEVTLARIAEIQRLLSPPIAAPAATRPGQAAAASVGPAASTDFATALRQATGPAGTTPSGRGGGIVGIAQGEVGQAESPPGSNNSARIAQYRSAVPGGPVGPWCAYFASWVAAQNGTPLGENGKGFARVDDVWAWAQRSSRAVPAGGGATPQPGDLIIWDEHMGIVESVRPDGSIQTIEGNSSDQVSRRVHGADGDGAVGFVRMS
jgi:hypothetical protein